MSPTPIQATCPTSPATLTGCWPIRQLPPNGILVSYEPLPDRVPPVTGEIWGSLTSNLLTMRVVRSTPGICGAIGADETLTAVVPLDFDGWGDDRFVACLRGPQHASGEAEAEAIFSSASAR